MVKVPKNVLEGLEFVRQTGLTNMFNTNVVISLCHEFDKHTTGVWIDAHRAEYAKGVIEGFEPDSPTQPTE